MTVAQTKTNMATTTEKVSEIDCFVCLATNVKTFRLRGKKLTTENFENKLIKLLGSNIADDLLKKTDDEPEVCRNCHNKIVKYFDFSEQLKASALSLSGASVCEKGETFKMASNGSTEMEWNNDVTQLNKQCFDEGRVIWTHEAIVFLIERRKALGNLFESNTTTQRHIWRKVSEELRTKGFIYSEDDCSKKFRNLRARHKKIKEKIRQTGNRHQSWRYFNLMEEMFAGGPSVLHTTVVSSMRPRPVPSPVYITKVHVIEGNPSNKLPPTSTPRVSHKRGHSGVDAEEPPHWFEKYQQSQREMRNERMALERRKVTALESVVKLLQGKQ